MDTITAIIETPKGSSEKYNYDPETKFFKLKKILPSGMVFPFDFGFIPDTKGQDGDPLDVIVLSEFHSFPGCVVECRIIGVITAEQSEKKKKIRNDRFLATPEQGKIFKKVNSIEDLPRQIMDELEQFFKNYNEIEGKIFQPLERLNAKEAAKKGLIVTQTFTAWTGPWGVTYAANLTSDSTGIGNWKEEQFLKALKEKKWMGLDNTRPLMPPMSMMPATLMTDDELKAIFAYLKTTPPIHNIAPEAALLPPPAASK